MKVLQRSIWLPLLLGISRLAFIPYENAAKVASPDSSSVLRNRFEEFEKNFSPSSVDHELMLKTRNARVKDSAVVFVNPSRQNVVESEEAQGFRVQIMTTNVYDDAAAVKEKVNAEFPDCWIYLIYESPTYKVRAGDFISRPEATKLVEVLNEKGYKGHWVVQDRVRRNPPPKPPVEIRPDSSIVVPPSMNPPE